MRERGLEPMVLTSPGDHVDLTADIVQMLSRRERPTAVVCSSDLLAVTAYRAAAALGLAIGADLSVSGFDASAIGRSLVPALTSLKVPVDTIAELVVQQFVAEVQDPDGETRGRLVVPQLVLGASVGPVR
jgi:DNA-binding LacI/PurR family transcriptional regulator